VTRLDVALVFRDVRLAAGGLSIDVRDLADGLAARGHSVSVITSAADAPSENGRSGFRPEVALSVLGAHPPGRIGEAYGLSSGLGGALTRRHASIVHVFSCVPVYLHLAAMAWARRSGRALVWTPMIHPNRRRLWASYGLRGGPMRAFDALAPRAARHVDAVAAATMAEATEFRRLGCPRVAVIPPAVHPAAVRTRLDARNAKERFGLRAGPVVLSVAARAERRKGVDFALATIEKLRHGLADVQFVVIGSGGSALAERDGIRALGRVSDDDLRALYRAADVVFVPSSYEAFSRVVIEAWQQERPVVVTDRVGLAERVSLAGGSVVPYGEAGIAAEAIQRLIEDRALSEHHGRAGRALVDANYLVPTVVDRVEKLYREALDA
jgi:D-inositol-3-phosphate glycosyltransferase